MNIIKRVKAPTPKFFKVLRNIGLVLAAVGGTILAAPVALPVVLTTVGGTFLSVMPNLHSEDVLKTVVLASIGAVVSFIVSLALKYLIKKHKRG